MVRFRHRVRAYERPDERGQMQRVRRRQQHVIVLGIPEVDRAVDRLGLPDFSMPKAGADIADAEARATHLTYGLQPVHAAIEVLRAGERVEAILGGISQPAFIAHGQGDVVCPVANAERVAGLLGSADKTVVILPRSHHIVTRDHDRALLRSELRAFLVRVARPGR